MSGKDTRFCLDKEGDWAYCFEILTWILLPKQAFKLMELIFLRTSVKGYLLIGHLKKQNAMFSCIFSYPFVIYWIKKKNAINCPNKDTNIWLSWEYVIPEPSISLCSKSKLIQRHLSSAKAKERAQLSWNTLYSMFSPFLHGSFSIFLCWLHN